MTTDGFPRWADLLLVPEPHLNQAMLCGSHRHRSSP